GTTANKPPGQRGSGEKLAEKSKNKCLTLQRESVICTPRAAAKMKRHCSLTIYQTICVGTQSDMDS
ncbi:hypothetical protein, partial [Klebsiella pneumoniae]|uniref:hypothetical protein n=1 Tax=Klebsiella pneumoniae TaxID=573 RepID=UPI00292D7AD6